MLTSFELCTDDEIRKIIKSSGIKVSPEDIFPADVQTKSIDVLIPYLTKVVNLSISTGSFEGLKHAAVRPLLKPDDVDPEKLSSYRPISNLTFLSKLVERVVLSRLQNHMDAINFKCDNQFGYKKNHSTETLLIKLLNDILVGLDASSGVVLILIDLSAAFDTVNINKLINILHSQLNISGVALKWFKSYLKNRTQRVLVGNSFSDPVELSFGVPQGSVLGPILFNIYITCLSTVFLTSGFQTMSYADDNSGYQVFSLSSEQSMFTEHIPDLLQNISCWMEEYFLKLNQDKTKIIVFGSKNFQSNLVNSTVTPHSGKIIKIVDAVKYLGVRLDNRLTMKPHINKVTSNCYRVLRKIKSIRSFITQDQCETLINASVTSRLDYCNSLLFNLSWNNCVGKLAKVQRYSSKIILRKGRRQGLPYNIRLDILHWLPVEKRIAFKVLMIVFKCLHNKAPKLLSSTLLVRTTGRFSHTNMLYTNLFYATSSFGNRAFIYYAPRLWNSLPNDLRQVDTLLSFKKKLKTYLFESFDILMQRFNMYRS